jgi:hypothetical protein
MKPFRLVPSARLRHAFLFAAVLRLAACGTTDTPEPPASTEAAVETPSPPPPAASPVGGAVVQVYGHATGTSRWLLLDTDVAIDGATDCPSDLVLMSELADIPINTPAPESCRPELSVFALGTLPVLDATLESGWMAADKVVPVALPGPYEVLLNVVVVCSSDVECHKMLQMVAADRTTANDLYDINRMGTTFVIADGIRTINPLADKLTGEIDPAALAIRQRCARVAEDESGLYHAGRLNLIYVNEVEWQYETTNTSEYGHNCLEDSHPDIIFLRQAHPPELLSHEVGHALLGLAHAGYGNDLRGWTITNLMRGSVFYLTNPDPPDHFSLGQAYHAIFDKQSWLNDGGGRTETKDCQAASPPGDSDQNWPCPRLQLEWDKP